MRLKLNIKFFLISLFFSWFPLSNFIYAKTLQDITVVTENTPPFIQWNEKNKKVDGIVADRVQHILQILNIPASIEILPWPRAYDNASKQPYVMIFPLAKTEERDKIFKYAGVIYSTQTYLFKLTKRTNIKVDSLEDAKKYSIGVLRKDVRHTFLEEKKFPHIDEAADSDKNIRKLLGGRIDLIISTEAAVKTMLEKVGAKQNEVEKIFLVKELQSKRYLAFNKDTPDEIVDKIRAVVEKEYKADQ